MLHLKKLLAVMLAMVFVCLSFAGCGNEKTTENNEQREEIIRLKQEKSCLHDELVFTGKNRLFV